MQGIQTHISPQGLPGLALFLLTACCPVVRAAPVGGSLCSPLFLCTGPFGMEAAPLAQLRRGLFPCTHFGTPGCLCCSQPPPLSKKFRTLGRSATTTYCASFLSRFSFCGLFVCLIWGGRQVTFLNAKRYFKAISQKYFLSRFQTSETCFLGSPTSFMITVEHRSATTTQPCA